MSEPGSDEVVIWDNTLRGTMTYRWPINKVGSEKSSCTNACKHGGLFNGKLNKLLHKKRLLHEGKFSFAFFTVTGNFTLFIAQKVTTLVLKENKEQRRDGWFQITAA